MKKAEPDDISFDLSRVTKWFKRKSPAAHTVSSKHGDQTPSHSGDPATPHAPHHPTPHAQSLPEVPDTAIDLKAFWGFCKRYYPVLLILIPFLLAGYLRVEWLGLPQVEHWAENSVDSYYRTQISNQVNAQYPNLPPQNKQALVDKEFTKYKDQNSAARDEQIRQTAEQFRDHFRDDKTGETYIGDIDTYYFFKRTEFLLQYGHIGNRLIDGKSYDTYTLAPVGEFTDDSMLYHAVAWTYRILHTIDSNITLRFAFTYLPVFLAMLSTIPAFFLARRVGGNFGGFFAALLLAVHANYLTRTMGGSTDTDVYNVFFPLLIFWLFIEGFESNRLKVQILCTALAGFFVGLYSFAWGGWWYIFDFILATVFAYFVYRLLFAWRMGTMKAYLREKNTRDLLLIFGVFLVISAIGVTLFTSWNNFTESPFSPLQIFTFKQASQENLWPNVYTTVAELNEVSIQSIMGSLGGRTLLLLSLLGLVFAVGKWEGKNLPLYGSSLVYYLLLFSLQGKITNSLIFTALLGLPIAAGIILSLVERKEIDAKLAIVFTLWYIGMIYASTKGVRFTMLIVPPFAIGSGMFAGYLAKHFGNWLNRELKVGATLSKGILIVLLSILLIAPVRAGFNQAESGIPLINDAWWHVLEKIKEVTPPHAIITSWWDYGHWFKAVADRPVTFDGANQNNPQAYWVGKLFLAWDERESLAILRMLDCSGMEAGNTLDAHFNDTYKTATVLNQILALPLPKARELLLHDLSPADADAVLAQTHCRPPPAVVITSEDMVGKSGVWGHFGSWDFRKAKAWITVRGKSREAAIPALQIALNITTDDATAFYQEIAALPDENAANHWISPWPGIGGGSANCQRKDNTTLLCPVNVQGKQLPLEIDLRKFTADLKGTDATYHPDRMAYVSNDQFNVRLYSNTTLGISLSLIQSGNSYVAVYMDSVYPGSLFTRLFYFNGKGTQYFQRIAQERDLTGLDIIAWHVDWDSYLNDVEGKDAQLPESPYKSNYPSWA